MDLAALRDYLGAKPGAMEDLPFGPEVLVLKVAGKMFALVAWQEAAADDLPQGRAPAGTAVARALSGGQCRLSPQ